jgi:hypothetical protein
MPKRRTVVLELEYDDLTTWQGTTGQALLEAIEQRVLGAYDTRGRLVRSEVTEVE